MSSLTLRNVVRLGVGLGLAGLLGGCVTPLDSPPSPTPSPTPTVAPTLHQTFEGWDDGYSRDGLWRAWEYSKGPGKNTFALSNVSVDDGELRLNVSANKTVGAEVSTVGANTSYGYYETRMKTSPVPGVVSAFFLGCRERQGRN